MDEADVFMLVFEGPCCKKDQKLHGENRMKRSSLFCSTRVCGSGHLCASVSEFVSV